MSLEVEKMRKILEREWNIEGHNFFNSDIGLWFLLIQLVIGNIILSLLSRIYFHDIWADEDLLTLIKKYIWVMNEYVGR